MATGMPDAADSKDVRSAVLHALAGRLDAAGRSAAKIDETSQLLQLGLIDSGDLIEVILEVEQRCGCEFTPEELNLETGLTIGSLVAAFIARG
jgi:acyl carrier protein